MRRELLSAIASLLIASPAMALDCKVIPQISPTIGQVVPEKDGSGTPTVVKLNGQPSKDAKSYLWRQTGGPGVKLDDPTSAQPTFSAPEVGPSGATLTFMLTVSGCSPTQYASLATTVNVTNVVTNRPPVATASVTPGAVYEGTLVTLDGSASSDPDGDALSYSWSQLSGPAVVLSADGANATFSAPNDVPFPNGTSLSFRLTVSDGSLSASADQIVNVQWVNDPPKAELSCPVSVNEGAQITLDGSGSTDSDDGISTYDWSQTLGTPNATLPAYDQASATSVQFAAPALTSTNDTMTFRLLVTDNGGLTDSKECAVKVLDITPPVISNVPANITAEATSAAGAAVTYTAPSALDNVDGLLAVDCTPASGATFALGTSTVNCSVSDAAHNSASASFTVKVQDTIAPAVTPPAPVTVEATGPSTEVAIGMATATDAVGVKAITNNAPAGYPVGVTFVTWSASDDAGNIGTATQSITVTDTTPPTLSGVPTGITVVTGQGVTYAPTATDLVDGSVPVVCTPASGSTFALGATAVSCSAKDSHDNTATGRFNVTVNYGFNGLLAPYDANKAYKIKSAIPLKWQYTNSTGVVLPSAAAQPSVVIHQVSNGVDSDEAIDLADAGASGLQYDSLTNTWQFNWKTTGLPSGTYNVYIQSALTGQKNGPFKVQLSK